MRKLFGTDGIRGLANVHPITADLALRLGKAAAIVLRKRKKNPRFIIGKDTRLSGYMLENALTAGLTSLGAEVMLVGPMPTPAIAHLVRSFAADAGIVISASHNPYTDNGIKFFDSKGFKLPDKTEEKIESYLFSKDLEKHHVASEMVGTAYRIDDASGRYIEFAKSSVKNMSLKGFKIALDCANGAAYKVAPLILSELGAELTVLNDRPNGININKGCGALHPEVVQRAVKTKKADIGLALDGDADRLIVVDEKGTILDGDHLMVICALHMLKKGMLKNDTLVVTHYTNLAVDPLIKKHGGDVVRVANGDRHVIEEMRKNDYNFGGEQSGHLIFSDYNSTGDGTIAALQLLRVMKESGKNLSVLSKELDSYPQVHKAVKVKKKIPLEMIKGYPDKVEAFQTELGNEGRLLVRYSGTENKLRIMVEGKDEAKVKKMAKELTSIIKQEIGE